MEELGNLISRLEGITEILDKNGYGTWGLLILDAVDILKKQHEGKQPVNPKWHGDTYSGECPDCGRIVQFAQRYCHNCTRALDWKDLIDKAEKENDIHESPIPKTRNVP